MALVHIGDILRPDQNNFTALRLLAASAVVVSHAIYLYSGSKADEILSGTTYYNLGDHAVNLFFVLSGLTVAASLERSKSTVEFVVARCLRIFPALLTYAAIVILFGMMVTVCAPAQYLSDARVWTYGLRTVLLSSATTGLPGVFEDNPHPLTVNASIWTLKFELACYLLLAFLGSFKLVTKRHFIWLFGALALLAASLLVARLTHDTTPLDQAARFWLCFSLGIGFYLFRDRIPLSFYGVAVLGLSLWLSLGHTIERVVEIATIGYTAVWLAKLPVGVVRSYTNQIDLSYGVYIFGWPVTQLLIWMRPDINIWVLAILSVAFAAMLAVPSWLLVERPALEARKVIGNKVRTLVDRFRTGLRGGAVTKVSR